MSEFFNELCGAMAALFIIALASLFFMPGGWFWLMFGLALAAVVLYIGCRFFKLLGRCCLECGSLRVTRERRMRRPYGRSIGLVDCEIATICHNPICQLYGKDQKVRSYLRQFNHLERLWRLCKGEKFP